MPRHLIVAVVAGACLLPAGCGTVCNLAIPGQRVPYGGVSIDRIAIDNVWGGGAVGAPSSSGSGGLFGVFVLIAPVVDLPLSAVGDTLTLPLVQRMGRHSAGSAAAAKGAGGWARSAEPSAAADPGGIR